MQSNIFKFELCFIVNYHIMNIFFLNLLLFESQCLSFVSYKLYILIDLYYTLYCCTTLTNTIVFFNTVLFMYYITIYESYTLLIQIDMDKNYEIGI